MASESQALLHGKPRRAGMAFFAVAAVSALAVLACLTQINVDSVHSPVVLAQKHAMSTQKSENDLRAYFNEQQRTAAAVWKPSNDMQQMMKADHLKKSKAAPFTAKTADAQLDAYFQAQAALAKKPRTAIKPQMYGTATPLKEAVTKHGFSTSKAMSDLNGYYKDVLGTQKHNIVSAKGVAQQLYNSGCLQVSCQDGAGFGPPPNTFQDPTKWNADSSLTGGNKEWAEEDAALHALNLQKWRNKILGEQVPLNST
jgi:hypothetical protein